MTDKRPPGITFRPPLELRDRLKRFADAHRWSMNVAIEQLVTEALNAREDPDGSPYTDDEGDLTAAGERYITNMRARREP
jgi:hypothetical protein